MKKPYIFFVKAIDPKYKSMAEPLIKSYSKFHPKDTIRLMTQKDYKEITGYSELNETTPEPTPAFAKHLIKDYELVVSLDSDQIILGDLNYIIDHRKEYDLGTVYNLNRIDPLLYKPCELSGISIDMYYNTGLIAFTNEELIDHYVRLSDRKMQKRFTYGDQDPFNIIAHFFGYRVKCFDDYDEKNNYAAWHGLKAKGEGLKMIVKGNKVILPKDKDGYPERDTLIKVYHWAGGVHEKKHNYHLHFKDDVVKYINSLLK